MLARWVNVEGSWNGIWILRVCFLVNEAPTETFICNKSEFHSLLTNVLWIQIRRVCKWLCTCRRFERILWWFFLPFLVLLWNEKLRGFMSDDVIEKVRCASVAKVLRDVISLGLQEDLLACKMIHKFYYSLGFLVFNWIFFLRRDQLRNWYTSYISWQIQYVDCFTL